MGPLPFVSFSQIVDIEDTNTFHFNNVSILDNLATVAIHTTNSIFQFSSVDKQVDVEISFRKLHEDAGEDITINRLVVPNDVTSSWPPQGVETSCN
uniref:Uncharacterized protein n=1 Tax=Salix viminalis TaxID=40686 RepID=A0A6N2M8V7_SALVM